jgi:hypothetical protein
MNEKLREAHLLREQRKKQQDEEAKRDSEMMSQPEETKHEPIEN